MKLLNTIVLVFFSNALFAQANFEAGFVLTKNFNPRHVSSENQDEPVYYFHDKITYEEGIFMAWKFKPRWSLNAEVSYRKIQLDKVFISGWCGTPPAYSEITDITMENISSSLGLAHHFRIPDKKLIPGISLHWVYTRNVSYFMDNPAWQGRIQKGGSNYYLKISGNVKYNINKKAGLRADLFCMGIVRNQDIEYTQTQIIGSSLAFTYQFSVKNKNCNCPSFKSRY